MDSSSPTSPDSGLPRSLARSEAKAWIVCLGGNQCERARALLEGKGWTVSQTSCQLSDAEDWWTELETPPDFIVLDIGRNVDRGEEAIHQIRRLRIEAPILVVTEDFSRDFGAKILSLGIRYYLPKDFAPAEFLELVECSVNPESHHS